MDTKSFFELDFNSSLFPLKTNFLLIQNHHEALETYIAKILSTDPIHAGDSFLAQTRVHAAKPKNHLRRTLVLDPVASYFLYDLVNRNHQAFALVSSNSRQCFGYRFESDQPVPVHKSYQEFTAQVVKNSAKHFHAISFDIASYFNSIYHHDMSNWFSSLNGVSGVDANAFGRFSREINAGRSIDFLPQGIYPSKMIGSAFLRFIEVSEQIKCAQSLRFMDDIYLFDDDSEVLVHDFHRVQELLGLRGLNINPTKTVVDAMVASVQDAASAIQLELAAIVHDHEPQSIFFGSGAEEPFPDEDEFDQVPLETDQIDRLLELLVDPKAEEADVEKILGILHEHTDSIAPTIPHLLAKFPNIVKQLHKLAGLIVDKDELTNEIIALIDKGERFIEYQLFWIACIAEDHLDQTTNFGKLIMKLYEKTSEYKIARAKILEIPDQSFGLKEIREEILKSGASDWSSWAAAMGTRTLKKAERNYALKYFAKGSPLNYLISECVQKFP
jgi:hypothetical protein